MSVAVVIILVAAFLFNAFFALWCGYDNHRTRCTYFERENDLHKELESLRSKYLSVVEARFPPEQDKQKVARKAPMIFTPPEQTTNGHAPRRGGIMIPED